MSIHYVPARRPPTPDIMADVLSAKTAPELIDVLRIKTNGGTQMRAGLNTETVGEYMQTLKDSDQAWPFPPVVVFFDGTDYWLADGFHRVAAMRQLERTDEIPVDVRIGDRRAAVLYAAGANAVHGLRRTNADKRRAVEVLLRDEEWAGWSNVEIARRCAVSESSVRNIRSELERTSQIAKSDTRIGTDGRTQNTANIGANRPAPQFSADAWTHRHERAVASRAQPPAPQPAPQKPAAWDGVTAHTWDGYADWDGVDQAEYDALSPIWQQPAATLPINADKDITRWRVAARLASERQDNIAFTLQETARRLMRAERYAADAAKRQAEPAPVAEVVDFELFAAAERAYLGDLKPGQMRRPFQWGDGYWVSVGGVYSPGTAPGEFDEQHCVRVHPDGEPIAPGVRIGRFYRAGAYLPDTELRQGSAVWRMGAQWLVVKRVGQRYQQLAADAAEPQAEPVPVQHTAAAAAVDLDDLEVAGFVTLPVGGVQLDADDDESATLAAKRMNRLHTLKVRFKETIDMLDEFGDLTGRHTASLLAKRELANLIEILDGEMDALEKGVRGV